MVVRVIDDLVTSKDMILTRWCASWAGSELFEFMRSHDLEGIVAKRPG
jgi:hypothetical protein